jgi:DNA-binding transcriptional regulator LsrR (DeoR family)
VAKPRNDPLTLALNFASDDELIVRAAWLYHVAGFTQEEVAGRLGLHRSRVNRLIAEARERGLVSVTIHHESGRELEAEQTIVDRFGLDFCLSSPAIGVSREFATDPAALRMHGLMARRAVGTAGAGFLRGKLDNGPLKIGVSWGRTIAQIAHQLSGVRNAQAQFVSLLGSLTRNSASNPFEVVQAFAARTGGEGHFLPVPFIADSEADRDVLMSQRSVAEALALARSADLFLISAGELTETAFLREQNMLSVEELRDIRARGAVCDTLGRLFDASGRQVDHELSRRTLAVDSEHLRGRNVVLAAGGLEKVEAIDGLLHAGLVAGLITDGDTALALAERRFPTPTS